MQISIQKTRSIHNTVQIPLTSSKSESNRALLIQALCTEKIALDNLSAARDTQTMMRLLKEKSSTWDVLDAGTTMRFCTAFLGLNGRQTIIKGTERMHQRPIKLLVDALRSLGADIQYLEAEGFPPLKITGLTSQKAQKLQIPGDVSSQYISALLMIGPVLPNGITIELIGEVFSRPYIEMTLTLMKHFGAEYDWKGNQIIVQPQPYKSNHYSIESDWSGASYWYGFCALEPKSSYDLLGLRENSYQGDQAIIDIMSKMGVGTSYDSSGAKIQAKSDFHSQLSIDFKTCPDLAQTVMVIAACKGIVLQMTGLESLRIKETERIAAMRTELKKLNASLIENGTEWELQPGILPTQIAPIETYDDHRMAMAFAPVGCLRTVQIKEPDVVKKSYPDFWNHVKAAGFQIK